MRQIILRINRSNLSLAVLSLVFCLPLKATNATLAPHVGQLRLTHREILRIGDGTAESVAWSPDSNVMAVGGSQGIRLYTSDFREMQYLGENAEPTSTLAWSPDGTKIASFGSRSNYVQVRDGKTGKLLTNFNQTAAAVAWSPDSKKLASTAGEYGSAIDIWDVSTGTTITTFQGASSPDTIDSLSWSPDGQKLAGSGGGPAIRVWSAETGKLITSIDQFDKVVDSVAWSPDGTMLAAAGNQAGKSVVFIWSTLDFHIVSNSPPNEAISSINWSPDSTKIASAISNGTAITWDVASKKVVTILPDHQSYILSVVWRADGQQLATTSSDNTVKVWTASGQLITTLGDAEFYIGVSQVAWDPNHNQLAAAYDGYSTIELLDPNTGTPLVSLTPAPSVPPYMGVAMMAWSPSGDHLASAFAMGDIEVWAAPFSSSKTPLTITQANGSHDIAWDPTGSKLVSVGGYDASDRKMVIWDPTSGVALGNFQNDTSQLVQVAWSPNGKLLATQDSNGGIQLWDAVTRQLLSAIAVTMNTLPLDHVAWSPNSKRLAGANCQHGVIKTCSIELIDASTGTPSSPFQHQVGWLSALAWSPDGRYIATDDGARTVYIWDADTGQVADTLNGNVDAITSISWRHDGNMLATSSEDGSIRIWEFSNS